MNQQFRIKHIAMYRKSVLKNVNLAVKKFRKQTSSKFRRQFLANSGGNEKIYLLVSKFQTRVFSSFERMRNQLDGDREQR